MTIKAQTEIDSPPVEMHITCERDPDSGRWHAEVFMPEKTSEAWGSGPLIAVAIAITQSGVAL